MSDYRDISISVGVDVNDNVELTIWLDIIEAEAIRVSLSPGRAASLLRDLTNQTTYALTGSATSIARGDCGTCGNVRMVKVAAPGGRESNNHCPDCSVETKGGYPLRPQVGGGLA